MPMALDLASYTDVHVPGTVRRSRLLFAIFLTRIVVRIQVVEAQRTDGRHLGDVLTGFCPMEMRRIAGQNNDTTGWIRLDLICVEPIAKADIEDTGHGRVDTVLGVSVRHELHA